MDTEIRLFQGSAHKVTCLASQSVDLIVTSPPYPMIEMWDGIFAAQDKRIAKCLTASEGQRAFELMHSVLDGIWTECDRLLKPGGIACVNIGDATRTMAGDFQLYSNHSRILNAFLDRGYAALPDILWRKQTNAPNKFMGSGMLPVGAYVTYEHEYILVLRKGLRRQFTAEKEKSLRRASAFFWEERNVWFSDVWFDIKGTPQKLVDTSERKRSGAFPFELAYRLIAMFSIKGDRVLDPFVGTGTTLAAALAAGRNAVGVEIDESLVDVARQVLVAAPDFANSYARDRLARHLQFAVERTETKGPLKHRNKHYQFPVVTAQEKELLIGDVLSTTLIDDDTILVRHDDEPQKDMVGLWESRRLTSPAKTRGKERKRHHQSVKASTSEDSQEELRFENS